jgi:hypothetical protein
MRWALVVLVGSIVLTGCGAAAPGGGAAWDTATWDAATWN